jgi:hypothetical protein
MLENLGLSEHINSEVHGEITVTVKYGKVFFYSLPKFIKPSKGKGKVVPVF